MRDLKYLYIIFLTVVILTLSSADLFAQGDKPKPGISDGKYGQYERNTFDLWLPKSKKATPLVVYIHGGGFNSGSKENITANQLNSFIRHGYAVMAINYRLLPDAVYPQHYNDAVRAIQFARANSKEWNIDKSKIAGMGSSAGALTALWIAFNDDKADPQSSDPVERESSRLAAVLAFSGQTTLEPELLRDRIGDIVLQHSFMRGRFFGLRPSEMNSAKAEQLIRDASPMTYLTKDDPPVWAYYSVAANIPKDKLTVSDAIHHPEFGVILKEKMDELKIECKLRHKDDGGKVIDDMVAFLKKHIK